MIFPPALPVLVVVLNGSIVRSYNPAFVQNGRVIAPLEPFVTDVAATIATANGKLIVKRGDRFVLIDAHAATVPGNWQSTYVELAPLMRALGLRVAYDSAARRLEIASESQVVVTPTPFNPAAPSVAPSQVFTPTPVATPRPVVTSKPMPRRTPLPVPCCTR